ncbi:hypothetical protein OP500_01005 [Kingella sp. SNUBH-2017]|uniref:hypothetical protein n=1 Tax=Kingella sp. SNUBH-2017 TaxID=2994077 RepID=UPI0023635235|nr:hypothetical protein [Kingella sp. SNUBH-2017]MDD2181907.1 hypothetical protein [Kingella sp. SNUBH-2017]
MSRAAGLKSAQYSGFGGGGVWDLENGGNLKTEGSLKTPPSPPVTSLAAQVRYATLAQAGILVASQQRVVFSTITACAGIA